MPVQAYNEGHDCIHGCGSRCRRQESKFAKFNLTVNPKRVPFKELVIPGIIEAEDFDKGGEGFTFHASDSKNNGVTTYRTDTEGVDILKITGGYAVGNTKQNEWQEYTVNVMEEGKYYYEITYASSASARVLAPTP